MKGGHCMSMGAGPSVPTLVIVPFPNSRIAKTTTVPHFLPPVQSVCYISDFAEQEQRAVILQWCSRLKLGHLYISSAMNRKNRIIKKLPWKIALKLISNNNERLISGCTIQLDHPLQTLNSDLSLIQSNTTFYICLPIGISKKQEV